MEVRRNVMWLQHSMKQLRAEIATERSNIRAASLLRESRAIIGWIKEVFSG